MLDIHAYDEQHSGLALRKTVFSETGGKHLRWFEAGAVIQVNSAEPDEVTVDIAGGDALEAEIRTAP